MQLFARRNGGGDPAPVVAGLRLLELLEPAVSPPSPPGASQPQEGNSSPLCLTARHRVDIVTAMDRAHRPACQRTHPARSRWPRRCLALCASVAIIASAGAIGCQGGMPAGNVVQVGRAAITQASMEHWISVLASFLPSLSGRGAPEVPDPPRYTNCTASLTGSTARSVDSLRPSVITRAKSQCERRYNQLKERALGFLIADDWVLGEAAELGVALTESELALQLRQFKQRVATGDTEFREFLAHTGETQRDVLLQATVEGLTTKIARVVELRRTSPSAAQVTAFYNTHPGRFRVAEQRDLRLIRTRTLVEALKVTRSIRSGMSFAAVVKAIPLAQPIDTEHGLLRGLTPRFFSESVINDAVFAASPHVLTGPIHISLGYYVFEVTAVRAAHERPFALVHSAIRKELETRLRRAAAARFAEQSPKKWGAKTDCRVNYVVPGCRQYK